ncbi:MAG: tRNA guanosine(34) transglycosylase Tgt [Candidatus Bipolaricaulia bacterium]
MSVSFEVTVNDRQTAARTGVLNTPHGTVETPAFVAVATQATVKALTPDDLRGVSIQMTIANTYHLHLQPGEARVAGLGGLHRFMGWDGPMMTDSGGFQIFSLGAGKEHGVGKIASIFPEESGPGEPEPDSPKENSLVEIDEDGVEFRSHLDGSLHRFTPEGVIDIQRQLGADIILVLDECTSPLHDRAYTERAMERTHRWAVRTLQYYASQANRDQALFGIVQGGAFQDLRDSSAQFIGGLGFDGLAIGGSLGKSKRDMHRILEWTVPRLPERLPRHLLGIGEVEDIFEIVSRGIDTFDCAAPTRLARNGALFVRGEKKFRIQILNARFKDDPRPVAEGCRCYTCRHLSRAYLHHLFNANELLSYRLASLHNLYFIESLVEEIREAIRAGWFSELRQRWLGHA